MKIFTFVLVLSAQFSPFICCPDGSLNNVSGSYFNCLPLNASVYSSSVHKLRPSDIRVIGAMGDSVTTGLGAFIGEFTESSNFSCGNLSEYRGLSWSGGEVRWGGGVIHNIHEGFHGPHDLKMNRPCTSS